MSPAQKDPILRYVRNLVAGHECQERSDQQLLDDFAARRKEAAFAALVGRHGPMVLRVCRRVLGHEQDAEDAFQATFLVLARNSASIRKREALADWLHGVAYRTAMKAKRSAARRRTREERVQAALRPSASPMWDEVQAALDEELRRLSEPFRQAFVLCVLEGKSGSEAAVILGCKEGTVSSRVTRARQQLQRHLTRRGINLGALLAGLAIAEGTSRAVAGLLVHSTVRYGVLAAGGAAAPSQIPAHVSALAQGVSGATVSTKIKLATVALLMAGLLTAGAGVVAQQVAATTEPPVGSQRSEVRTQEPAPAGAKEIAKPPAPNGKDSVSYSGRVFGPDKKPVAGAHVYYHFITRENEPIPARARTDAHGRFSFSLTELDVPPSADGLNPALKVGQIVVKADGFAFAWRDVALERSRDPGSRTGILDLSFKLAPDDLLIRGRILDLQGKPLPGLRITVLSMAAPDEGDLTPFLQGLKPRESVYAAMMRYLPFPFGNQLVGPPHELPILPVATTGADGRFRLAGFAREHLIELRIEGPSIETQNLFVINRARPANSEALLVRPRFPIQDPDTFGPSEQAFLRWNNFEHAAAPGQTVVGTVRDEATKAPIGDAVVESYMLAGTNLAENAIYRTIADARGRYRFTGLPRGKGNMIRIRPPKDQPYLPVVKTVPAKEVFAEAAVNVELPPGIFVNVTARDKRTGKPVSGGVSYFVLPERFETTDPFRRPFADAYENSIPMSNDGNCRFVAVPRKAIVAFRAVGQKYPIAREAPNIRLPGLESPANYQAFVTIDPRAKDPAVKVHFVLDTGGTAKCRVVGPDGQLLAGALATGLRHDWYPNADGQTTDVLTWEGQCTAVGLDPKHPRLVCFANWGKKLAGSVILRGDEAEPVTARLQPWATARGRLLDADSKPIKNATLWFTEVPRGKVGQPRALDVGLHVVDNFAGKPDKHPRTDDKGRFNIEALVPGLKYNLALIDERGVTEFEQIKWEGLVFNGLVFQPGQIRDLGDVKLQPFPKE